MRLRRTSDGRFLIWRGRVSLARLTGLTTRTVTSARAELLRIGLFKAVPGCTCIEAEDGTVYRVARGVRVLELVWNIPAFTSARERKRHQLSAAVENEIHAGRIDVQRAAFMGEFDDQERQRREQLLRDGAWRDRGRRW